MSSPVSEHDVAATLPDVAIEAQPPETPTSSKHAHPLVTGRQWLAVGLLCASIIVVFGLARITHATAHEAYLAQRADFERDARWATNEAKDLAAVTETGSAAVAASASTLTLADGLVDQVAQSSISTSQGALSGLVKESLGMMPYLPPILPKQSEAPTYWQILDYQERLTAAQQEVHRERAMIARLQHGIKDTREELRAGLMDVVGEARAGAEASLAGVSSATNLAHWDLSSAVTDAGVNLAVEQIPDAIRSLLSATDEYEASHLSEEAEKAGPLYNRRVEIEAYARSLAGDVRLDFDWAVIVAEVGLNGTAGGTATVDQNFPQYSSISLSHSVAHYWPRTMGLVAHEVGHAVTARCWKLFERNFGDDLELWAVAWAIGHGHTEPNLNGAWVYGHPTSDQVQIAQQCR